MQEIKQTIPETWMTKKVEMDTFSYEMFSKPPKGNFPMNKITYNLIDEMWSIDLADISGYKISNNIGLRHKFVIIEKISNYIWCLILKKKNGETIKNEFPVFPTSSKRKLFKKTSDRDKEFQKSTFQNLLKQNDIRHYSRFTDNCPSIGF